MKNLMDWLEVFQLKALLINIHQLMILVLV